MIVKTIQFINEIKSDVAKVCASTKLYPSVMIAQAILESNSGHSKLSLLHNNFFGIKAGKTWQGAVATFYTTEYVNKKLIKIKQNFRSYPTRLAGFTDRCKFLQVNKRYTDNGVFAADSAEQQAKAFLKAGYATDPGYADKLISLIRTYNLQQYD